MLFENSICFKTITKRFKYQHKQVSDDTPKHSTVPCISYFSHPTQVIIIYYVKYTSHVCKFNNSIYVIREGVIWGRAAEANNPTHIRFILGSILKFSYFLWHQLLLQRPIWSSYQHSIQYLLQSGMWVFLGSHLMPQPQPDT